MMESNRGKGDFVKVTTWRRQKEKTERSSYTFTGGLRKEGGGGIGTEKWNRNEPRTQE